MTTLDDIWNKVKDLPSKDAIADKVKDKIGSKSEIANAVASVLPAPPDPTAILQVVSSGIEALNSQITQIREGLQSGFSVNANVTGDAKHPVAAVVTANVGGTKEPIKLAPVEASVNASVGGDIGVKALVGGIGAPIQVAPLKLELGPIRLAPNIAIEFRLFGILISSVRITGNASVN
jgi:hypothetical protein